VAILGYLSWFGLFIDRRAAPARVGLGVTICLTQAALQIPVSQYIPVNSAGTWIGKFQTVAFAFSAFALFEYTIVNYFLSRRRKELEKVYYPIAWLFRSFHMMFRTPLDSELEREADAAATVSPSNVTLEEQLKPAVEEVFSRYDLDGSGFIDNAEEFDQLTTYLLFTMGHTGVNQEAVSEKMKHMAGGKPETLRAMKFDVEHYIKWFADAAKMPQQGQPASESVAEGGVGVELRKWPAAATGAGPAVAVGGVNQTSPKAEPGLYAWPPKAADFADWIETFTRTAYFIGWTGYLTASYAAHPGQ